MMLKKLFKILAAVAVFSVGIAALNRGKTEMSEVDSVIDARVVSVKAVSAGLAKFNNLEVGQTVHRGDDIIVIDEATSNSKHKSESDLDSRSLLLQNISSLESFAAEKSKQAEIYRAARLRQLDAKIDEALLSAEIARAKIRQTNAALDQKRSLLKAKLVVPSVLTAAEAVNRMSEIELNMLSRKTDALKAERIAASKGVYLGDNYNDTSYSQQRVDEINVRLLELRAQAARQPKPNGSGVQVASSNGEITLGSPEFRSVKSPVDGRVWKMNVNDGDTIREGDELAQVADCRSMFVTARKTDRQADRTAVGDQALFFGKNGSHYEGRVTFAIDGDFDGLANSALGQKKPVAAARTLVVSLRPNEAQVERCSIGLSGRLVINGEPAEPGPEAFYSRVAGTAEQIKTLVARLYERVRLYLG